MKLTTLRKLERASFSMRKRLEQVAESDPDAKPYLDRATEAWVELFRQLNRREEAIAEKADHGEVLFTVFVPDKMYVKEIVVTPHREISTLIWKRTRYDQPTSPPILERSTVPSVRIASRNSDRYWLLKVSSKLPS